ncbi:MAG: hypothetical protein DRJ65_20260 [Acidobacteria bacterium]|nr:MAG: hypothetical protein DRJ65_20260 [Acidobacteriota bacterium]
MRNTLRILCFAGLAAIIAVGVVHADDRDLLRSVTAPPNVLLILDSGASMTHDPETNTLNFLAGGDSDGRYADFHEDWYGSAALTTLLGPTYHDSLSRGSKLPQAKRALRTLFNSGFDFNYGFSYYEKTKIEINYLNFIYVVKDMIDTDGDGVDDTVQGAMLDGTQPGTPMRFGDFLNQRGNTQPDPFFPIRYGRDGDEEYVEWIDPNNSGYLAVGDSPDPGDLRLTSYLVDSSGVRLGSAGATAMYYYPAYNFSALSSTIQNGLDGSTTWESIATTAGLDLTDSHWKEDLFNAVVPAILATQMGHETLYIKEAYEEYQGSPVRDWVDCSTCALPQITEVQYNHHFVLYDHPWIEDHPSSGTLSAVDYQGSADCVGYLDTSGKTPIIPPSQPDANGATEDNRWIIDTYLNPQTTPIFYFPTNSDQFLPGVREDYIPMTETITSIGRRPIKDTVNEAKFYFTHTIAGWNDALAACRQNFLILITDGQETCAGGQAVCSAADNFPGAIYTIYLGTEANALNPDMTDVQCIADRSGGAYFTAGNEEELIEALLSIAREIEERTRGFSSPMVPSVEAATKQTAYLSTFTPFQERSIWRGHLRAYPIDPLTGVVANLDNGTPSVFSALWDAGDVLAQRWDWGDEFISSAYDSSTDPRKMYYGQDVSGTPTRKPFSYPGHADDSGTDTPFTTRQELGGLIYGGWPATYADELDIERVDLRNTIDFMRGVRYGTDENGDQIPLRDIQEDINGDPIWSSSYQWCGPTGDVGTNNGGNQGASCSAGSTVLGIEKLGDIFHSVPQRMSSPACFACYLSDYMGYRDFLGHHRQRRSVMFAGANDGSMHAFEAGLWDLDGDSNESPPAEPQTDGGTGRELFAWMPASVMDSFNNLANGIDQRYTVDGTSTVVDVYIDRVYATDPVAIDREWRTLLIWGQRRGGRSYVALDITQPDSYTFNAFTRQHNTNRGGAVAFETRDRYDADGNIISSWRSLTSAGLTANSGRDVMCADGTAAGCSGPWPAFRWEFTDTLDEEADVGLGVGNGEADLGYTWSQPLVGFLRVTVGGMPRDRMVAFFGGGYSPLGVSPPANRVTGNWIYGLDMETGEILLKLQVDGMVPGGVQGLDIDLDGFLEKLFFATTEGNVYRIDFSTAGTISNATGRVTNWTAEKIFDADGYQPFFMRPALVPISFNNDGTANVAIAIGSGNRDGIFELNAAPHRFYVFNEPASGTTVADSDLEALDLNSADQGDNFLFSNTVDGWYLELYDSSISENWEKVNTNALVIQDYVIFSTFNPVQDITVALGPPPTCHRGGSARTYVIGLANANSRPGEERYEDLGDDTAMASDPVVYLGADGKIHVIQATDNLEMEEPIAAFDAPVRMVNWREE